MGPAIFVTFETIQGVHVSIVVSKVQALVKEPKGTLIVLEGAALTYHVKPSFEETRTAIGLSLGAQP